MGEDEGRPDPDDERHEPEAACGHAGALLAHGASPRTGGRQPAEERARFVADEAAALATLVAPESDGHTEAVLVGMPGPDDGPTFVDAPRVPARRARIVIDEPEHVAIDVQGAPGLLVLTDATFLA
jgi:hypothetical protein